MKRGRKEEEKQRGRRRGRKKRRSKGGGEKEARRGRTVKNRVYMDKGRGRERQDTNRYKGKRSRVN